MRYWKREGENPTVESYSHDSDIEGAVEITEDEFGEFMKNRSKPSTLPKTPKVNKIAELEARIAELEANQAK